jgi:uncharacterized membrane protein YkvA (DUF1232 family)
MRVDMRKLLLLGVLRFMPPWLRLVLLAALAYVISPIDLAPDFIPVLGWADDIGVIALAIYLFRAWRRAWDRQQARQRTHVIRSTARVVEQTYGGPRAPSRSGSVRR